MSYFSISDSYLPFGPGEEQHHLTSHFHIAISDLGCCAATYFGLYATPLSPMRRRSLSGTLPFCFRHATRCSRIALDDFMGIRDKERWLMRALPCYRPLMPDIAVTFYSDNGR